MLLVLVQGIGCPGAAALELTGHLSGEARGFLQRPAFPGQRRDGVSLAFAPELYHDWDDGRHSLLLAPFLRLDSMDGRRSHFDLREAVYQWSSGSLQGRVGVSRVFWGVAESRHLVDVINQADLIEDVDGEDRLGQPMLTLAWRGSLGTIEGFVLPGFRERTFPGRHGRLRSEPVVDAGGAVYESPAGRHHVDFAVRWSAVIGDLDLGLSHFHGTSREPRLLPGLDSGGQAVLVPHYDQVDQSAVDVQLTRGAWAWKLEALHRSGQGASHVASVAGFEYTVAGVAGSRADLGLLAEHLFDGRGSASPQPFANDLFLGLRLAMNDTAGSEVLAGVIHDLHGQGEVFSVEASSRLDDHWRLEAQVRAWCGVAADDPQRSLARDDHLLVRVLRFF